MFYMETQDIIINLLKRIIKIEDEIEKLKNNVVQYDNPKDV